MKRNTVLVLLMAIFSVIVWSMSGKKSYKTLIEAMEAIVRFIIQKNEGGYVSPERAKEIGDTGGETKYGISKKSYPSVDIKNLTLDQAIAIYKRDFVSGM